ncbi:iron-containing alcohol dehydrogenase family protein [Spirillospora sp. CA-255316]
MAYYCACILARRRRPVYGRGRSMNTSYRRSPQRVFWGPMALDHLARELDREGAARPLLVCGASVRAHPDLLPRVFEALGGSVAGVFDGVRSHTPLSSVQEAAAALDLLHADSVIAIGGGSAAVTARAACILHAERRPIEELATRMSAAGEIVSPRLMRPKLPIIALPTTPTTAVCKAGTAVTSPDHHGRLAMFDPKTRSRSVVLAPEFLASSPTALVRGAALNALVMAVEGLATGRSHVFSDALLVHAIRQLTTLLPVLAEADVSPQHRGEAALAGIMAGDGTDTTGGGLTAALSHAIGHHYDAHNGIIDAILLPRVLEAMPLSRPALIHIAEGLGCAPEQAFSRLRDVPAAVGAPGRLRDVGVQLDDIGGLADEATTDFSYLRAAHQPGVDAVRDLLSSVW